MPFEALPRPLQAGLVSDDARRREAAVEQLRGVEAPSVASVLEAIIVKDPSPRVRVTAIFVGMLRWATELQRAFLVASCDHDARVRAAATRLLGMP
jgi:hypothetical protein